MTEPGGTEAVELQARPPQESRFDRFAPWFVLAVSLGFGLVELWSSKDPVVYPNDSAMHFQMVQFALHQLRTGHFPIDAWYPYLGLGSPHLQNYQGLPATLTAAVAAVIGPAHAFGWSLYLLLSLWPISVYWGARLFGLDRWTAAAAAAMSPLLMSTPGVGYEYGSYLWLGWGVWTQLWAMWALPLAWGFTWQAVNRRRYLLPAAFFVALTVALHFLTGYLAAMPVIVLPFLGRTDFWRRLGRAAIIAVGSFCLAAWVVVPVFTHRGYTALNEFLATTSSANSFGAGQILGWLVRGQIYDAGRFPIITIFLGVGLIVCILGCRRDPRLRSLLVLWIVCLVLFFGRPTLGPLLDAIPGSRNMFLRRFVVGVQLSGLLVAGVGVRETARQAMRFVIWLRPRLGTRRWLRALGVAAGLAALAPAWSQVASYASQNSQAVAYQRGQDSTAGRDVGLLVAKMKTLGPGRVYAGLPTNWGAQFEVGEVPVYIYLTSFDVDEVGFTLRTESLMSDPEAYFDDSDLGDYQMFGVRYLILPTGTGPSVAGAKRVLAEGGYSLWMISSISYFQVVDTISSIPENENDVGQASASLMSSSLQTSGRYLTVAFDGKPAPTPTLPIGTNATGAAGYVLAQRDDLLEGKASATVVTRRRAVVLLSSSFDPGWTVTVNGVPAKTEMIAPALVGVAVGPGVHKIAFVWKAFPGYPELFVLAVLTLAAFLVGPVFWRRRRPRILKAEPMTEDAGGGTVTKVDSPTGAQ